MKNPYGAWILGTLLLLSLQVRAQTPAASAKRCDPKTTISHYQRVPAIERGFSVTGPTCTALVNVIARMFSSVSSGGKKLEKDQALNVATATKERQGALADAEFAAALKEVQGGETDALRLLLLEAALQEEFANFAARDLVLRDARALLEK